MSKSGFTFSATEESGEYTVDVKRRVYGPSIRIWRKTSDTVFYIEMPPEVLLKIANAYIKHVTGKGG